MVTRLKFIALLALGIFGMVVIWPTATANLQSKPSKATYEVVIRLDETIVLPCVCKGKLWSGQGMTANWTGRTDVSVTVPNAGTIPLNYDYSVTGGGVYKTGPNVVWDLGRTAPGEYSITVTVDDGVGNSGRATRKVVLAESDCHCPCECPTIEMRSHNLEVRRGDKLDFQAKVLGGDLNNPTYDWRVENGTISSGQGTPAISAIASSKRNVAAVIATLAVGGTDVSCNCPIAINHSVPLGKKTTTQTFPPEIKWLGLDETIIRLACRYGGKSDERPSEDAKLEVGTDVWLNSKAERVTYRYTVSGGTIVGAGAKVQWDLTGALPGTYLITAFTESNGASDRKERTITLYEAGCREYLECPMVSLSKPNRIAGTNDFIIRADVTLDSMVKQLEWSAEGAEVLAGQGTKSIRIRSNSDRNGQPPGTTLNLHFEEYTGCPTTHSVSW